jgi:outer membrane protein TolC
MKWNFRSVVILGLAGLICGAIGAAQEPAPYRLTLRDAIQKALQANLNVLVADTRVEEAEGTRVRRLSAALLPQVRAQSYANYQNRSLAAFGISLPGVPAVVGPFSNYDFRVYAEQNIVDLQSYRGWKASERALDAGKMDYQDARDLIIRRGARGRRPIPGDRLGCFVQAGKRQA